MKRWPHPRYRSPTVSHQASLGWTELRSPRAHSREQILAADQPIRCFTGRGRRLLAEGSEVMYVLKRTDFRGCEPVLIDIIAERSVDARPECHEVAASEEAVDDANN